MGKGKGSIEYWCSTIFTGRILFELGLSISKPEAIRTLLKAGNKLPFRSKVVLRRQFHID